MIYANLNIISKGTIEMAELLGIDYNILKNSKGNTIAFTSHGHSRREFEVVFLKDGFYKINTRYLAYKSVMKKHFSQVKEVNDPDGRRKGFEVFTRSTYEINELLICF